ncbi:microcystin degradation protein MlrC [Streptomyces sp. B3I7]|uniref:hypothetical protein n=1 Tax=Streptomyces sp. B3I7 TaxID=3042269 RepID=UPI00278106A9|nr:hypothetical protein [Streptomyces sp. B3I7]MDQ0812511.1 microcystin degradation protein MlrC [Streptomyces sp. B3I7]
MNAVELTRAAGREAEIKDEVEKIRHRACPLEKRGLAGAGERRTVHAHGRTRTSVQVITRCHSNKIRLATTRFSWGSRVGMLREVGLDPEPVLAARHLSDEFCAECDYP